MGKEALILKNVGFRASSLKKSGKSEKKNTAVFLQFLRVVPGTFSLVSDFFCGH